MTEGSAPAGHDRPGRLLELAVADLAVIERARLEFDLGLNVLTGETGAGKSLLIDALLLVLGARADPGLVRHGASVARVEALFERPAEPLIAVREVAGSGRSIARLDDETVTAARLAETTGRLVEIHGQHDQGRLLDPRSQRALLDAYGGHTSARAAVAEAVDRWRANRAALAELVVDPRQLARRLEIAEHEAAEIAAARLRPGEAVEIRAQLAAAEHGETIARGAAQIREVLAGDGRGAAARDALGGAAEAARTIARVDARFAGLADRLAGLEAEVDDVASEVRRLAEAVEHDPTELARLSERLSTIYGLLRRYGDDEAAVLAYGERAAAEAERLRGIDAERERRTAQDVALLRDVAAAAARLSAARSATARELVDGANRALASLGFAAHPFSVALQRRIAGRDEPAVEVDGDALAFDASGIDEVVFRFAPNVGEPPRPLARIASGGELSRVALAVKEVLAAVDDTPTLVFDEIDAGIGTRGADPVGRSLWALARNHQVLCVTHLAQIAAYADAHFAIVKRARGGRTITEVRRLDREGRIVELGAMIAGGTVGTAALASARELLDRAEAWRAQLAASG